MAAASIMTADYFYPQCLQWVEGGLQHAQYVKAVLKYRSGISDGAVRSALAISRRSAASHPKSYTNREVAAALCQEIRTSPESLAKSRHDSPSASNSSLVGR